MNSAAVDRRAHQAATTSGFLFRPALADRQHLFRRAHQDVGDEMQDVADAAIDRDRIPGRADTERIDLTAREAVDHEGRRQHHQAHVLVGIDAARRHPEPQLIIVGRERKRHPEGQRLGAGLRRAATTRDSACAVASGSKRSPSISAIIAA